MGGPSARDGLELLTRHRDDGGLERTHLVREQGALSVRIDSGPAMPLPDGSLERVMHRYGRPLAEDVSADGPALDLGGGRALRRLRFRPRYDVIARDYLVFEEPGAEPLAELAIAVTAALVHLARSNTSHFAT
jgi:hypothetical protein